MTKYFPRQSGEILAIKADVECIRDMTRSVVEEVKSNPPPGIFRKLGLPIEAGIYTITQKSLDKNLTDNVGSVPPIRIIEDEFGDEAETLRPSKAFQTKLK
jgi:hypothetical protein